MKLLPVITLICLIVIAVASAGIGHAELPPGTYETLKQEAKEVLQIDVTKVIRLKGDAENNDSQDNYQCEARVDKVVRSEHGYKSGDKIKFATWWVDPKAGSGFAGPAIPPRIQTGWRGRVYLNPDEVKQGKADAGVLTLAAYGRSFEVERTPKNIRQRRFRLFRQR